MHRLFHGKETYLSLQAAKDTLKKLSSESGFNIYTIDGEQNSTEEIINTYQSDDMFSQGKVIFIKRLYKAKDKADILEDLCAFLEKGNENLHVVIWEDQKIPSNTKYFKFFNKSKSAEEATALNKRTFSTWAKEIARSYELDIEPNALDLLSHNANYNPERFLQEIKKLKLLKSEKVTEADIVGSTANTLENDIWQFIDALNRPNGRAGAMDILEKLLQQQIDSFFILSMIIRNTRLLILTSSLLELGYGNTDIARELRIPPFTVPSMISATKKTNLTTLKKIYSKIYSLDYEIKTGNITPDLGITLLCTVL